MWQPVYEGKLKRRQTGMPRGYKFAIEACPICGRQVPSNWMIRHLKSDCAVPKPRIYEAREDDS
jgi:hypothetical protein